jgi:GNAT superfamily N-acetyltransferase
LPFDIIYTRDPEIISKLGQLRVNSWLEAGAHFNDGFLSGGNTWMDEIDFQPNAHHWLAIHDGQIIGAGRLSFHQSLADVPDRREYEQFEDFFKFPTGVLSRLFVRKAFWGLGVGKALLEARLEFVRKQNLMRNLICFVCGYNRVKLMQQYGFKILAVRDSDKDIVIPEKFYVMAADLDANPIAEFKPFQSEVVNARQ